MQMVVDLTEEMYAEMISDMESMVIPYSDIVKNGTPLPKGHGRLIDVSDIEWAKHREERNYINYDVIDWDDIVNAPTIIEADKVECEG